jgi:hypothetical protein
VRAECHAETVRSERLVAAAGWQAAEEAAHTADRGTHIGPELVPEAGEVEWELLLAVAVAVAVAAAASSARLESIVPMPASWLVVLVLEPRLELRPEQEPEHTPSGSHKRLPQLQEAGVEHKQPLVVVNLSTAEASRLRCC